MSRARFITLEGGEGAGKSSQIHLIESWYCDRGLPVVTTREPGGTELSELIRDLVLHGEHREMSALTELLLIFAARAQHLEEVIRPALEEGKSVISDRFTDASFAYQGGGRELSESEIQTLADLVQRGLQPDLTLLLDIPVEIGLQRTKGRGTEDRFETESLRFLERVRQTYLERAAVFSERFQVIDASQDETMVWERIKGRLEALYP
jgi:dTMP kinase